MQISFSETDCILVLKIRFLGHVEIQLVLFSGTVIFHTPTMSPPQPSFSYFSNYFENFYNFIVQCSDPDRPRLGFESRSYKVQTACWSGQERFLKKGHNIYYIDKSSFSFLLRRSPSLTWYCTLVLNLRAFWLIDKPGFLGHFSCLRCTRTCIVQSLEKWQWAKVSLPAVLGQVQIITPTVTHVQ